jgi:thiamine biosynthesis lipoprotein
MVDAAGPDGHLLTSVHHGMLGTIVHLRIRGADESATARAEAVALAEIARLERIFSAYDPTSELCRWRAGDDAAPGPELVGLLREVRRWQDDGAGAFNPAVDRLSECWRNAAATGVPPDADELASLAAAVRAPCFDVVGDAVVRLGDCSAVTGNAIAKGHVVDRALAAAVDVDGVTSVLVNAGGDLAHRGTDTLRIGIEDPARPHDNAPPLLVVSLRDRALATSGPVRRGVRIGGHWYGHVLDPRTGRPVEHLRSASAIAPDATSADAAATVVSVLAVEEAIEWCDARPSLACCLVDGTGTIHRSRAWSGVEVPVGGAPG